MLRFVFGAFITARLTNLGAERTEFRSKRWAAWHELSGQATNIGAIAVKFDTPHHRFDVLFAQTRRRAMFACGYAFITGFDTTFVLFRGHNFYPFFCLLWIVPLPAELPAMDGSYWFFAIFRFIVALTTTGDWAALAFFLVTDNNCAGFCEFECFCHTILYTPDCITRFAIGLLFHYSPDGVQPAVSFSIAALTTAGTWVILIFVPSSAHLFNIFFPSSPPLVKEFNPNHWEHPQYDYLAYQNIRKKNIYDKNKSKLY